MDTGGLYCTMKTRIQHTADYIANRIGLAKLRQDRALEACDYDDANKAWAVLQYWERCLARITEAVPLAEQIRCHWEQMPMKTVWRISSRWPAWSKWKLVGPRPHGERWPFDAKGLVFPSEEDAMQALKALRAANEGEFMLVQTWL